MRFRYRMQIAACVGMSAALWAVTASAAVRLPGIFGDNMVLQCDQPVPVWGWADPGEHVTVAVIGKFKFVAGQEPSGARATIAVEQVLSTTTDENGRWKVTLKKLAAGQPLTMIVEGSSGNAIVLKNIVAGEVWICSGQSNMEWPLRQCNNANVEIATADYPEIRLFQVVRVKAASPATDLQGEWTPCTPKSALKDLPGGFSGVAYFFGRHLHKELRVPVGLIQTAWGGTPAEFWTSRKALEASLALKRLAEQRESSVLYNGMIAPLIPYAIRGAIWYQGESNVSRAEEYLVLFSAMIANWRADWGEGDFPFGFVQIAPFRYGGQDPTNGAKLREAQLKTLETAPNTGMAVTMDIASNVLDIHPTNKQDVGRRLALWALAKVYGRRIVYSGPIYKSMTIEGDAVRLRFEHVGGGLIAADGKPLVEFTIAAADRKFVPAVATIDGETIVVRADAVHQPVAVRYAWRDEALPNLANKEGLPASSFRTDDF